MSKTPLVAADTCFTENGQLLPLPRRALMEGAGSFLLMLIVVGTGMISQTRADDPLLRMLVIAIATSAALVGLIVSLGPVTGGHLNPLISGMQWFPGRERSFSCALLYILAQVAGAFAGAACANSMLGTDGRELFPLPITARYIASEALCSAGLMAIVFMVAKRGRRDTGPLAVGAWMVAAIVGTPSGSYANPAITLAATIAGGPMHLSTENAAAYIGAQLVGAFVAFTMTDVCLRGPVSPAPTVVIQASDSCSGDTHHGDERSVSSR